jgi:ketosteroid isomerase-like protein
MDSYLAELNRDIWLPFSQAYADRDLDAYLRLHTADLLRVDVDHKWLGGLAEYGELSRPIFAKLIDRDDAAEIRFRFFERLASADLASERGYFRLAITVTEPEPGELVFYGQFHTFARRVDGVWRLCVDYERGSASEEDFDSARALDDLRKD